MRTSTAWFVALLLPLGGLTACSDGEEPKSAASSTTTTIPTLEVDQIDRDASRYCEAWADIRALGSPKVVGDPEGDIAVRKAHYAEVVPLAKDLLEVAPDDIDDQVEAALRQVETIARTGSDEVLLDEDSVKLQQELAAYAQEHCSKG